MLNVVGTAERVENRCIAVVAQESDRRRVTACPLEQLDTQHFVRVVVGVPAGTWPDDGGKNSPERPETRHGLADVMQ